MNTERFARLLVLILVFGAGLAALVVRFLDRSGAIEVHAAMPDQGGWLTSNITAKAGEPLRMRLVSDDVVHSFALGQSDFEPVDVLPGKPMEITLTFDEPGTYTFFCTRWCGADHWRMRGTITVTGDMPFEPKVPEPPLYLQLGIDLDAPHELHSLKIEGRPSAKRGKTLGVELPVEFLTQEYYRTHSPYMAWEYLNSEPITADLADAQVWDLIGWIWEQNTNPAMLAEGEALYQRDCAACHGVSGAGDGVFGGKETSTNESHHEAGPDGHSLETPTNFQDLDLILFTSPALLQGKIIRGGMGTGMPSWGLIYTEAQTWALVDYLWTFVFEYSFDK